LAPFIFLSLPPTGKVADNQNFELSFETNPGDYSIAKHSLVKLILSNIN